MFKDTIAAISTALAPGAISIVRISGPDALEIASQVFSQDVKNMKPNTIRYGWIQENGKTIDEVLLSVFHAPRSYTAEDMVEINCHGGVHVTRKILGLLLKKGARLARPGEFTERAFLHGRIDLAQSEAVMDLIEAKNDQSAALAAEGLKGSVRRLVQPLIEDLLEIIAQIEVNIDYPEYEDIAQLTTDELLPKAEAWLKRMDEILERAQNGQMVKNGLNTVILGKPNVGKSSLLNALLEEEKAIVTDIPGTTRDIVEGTIQLEGVQLNLIDTAGIRAPADAVEQIGIEKSRKAMEKADLVLLVMEAGSEPDAQEQALLEATEGKNRLIVWNKTDLKQVAEGIGICAAKGEIGELLQALKEMCGQGRLEKPPLLSNERQTGLLAQAKADMIQAKMAMESGVEPDLVEIDLQNAHRHLKELFGEVSSDDLLDALFSRFCLGK